MHIELGEDLAALAKAEIQVMPVFASKEMSRSHAAGTFSANLGESGFVHGVSTGGAHENVTLGLGSRQELDRAAALHAGQSLGLALEPKSAIGISLAELDSLSATIIGAFVEGLALGQFRVGVPMKPEVPRPPIQIILPRGVSKQLDIVDAVHQGTIVARNANWVRHLVEMPPSELTPAELARVVAQRARELGVRAEIWDRDEIASKRFGGTLGVGAGSHNPPAVVVLHSGKGQSIGLAGKGVTFDAGGINLKRDPAEIAYMKSDMAGAAAVAGAIFCARELNLDPSVLAVLPMAENMPGGGALKPGDVVTHPDGQRTEVVDTDSEGRLLLADAIAWLGAEGVCGIVDVGTLSDGGGVGPLLWGLWSNDDALANALLESGKTAVDPGWRLPLHREYARMLPSRIADSANAPSKTPDTGLMAATFLSRFAGTTPWAHIDNGSSAYLLDDIGAWPEGATSSPMRALFQLLSDRSNHDA